MLRANQRTDEAVSNSREVYGITLRTAYPALIEAFLVALMGIISNIMVGSLGGTLGDDAIAGVGITGQPRMILLACVFSLNIGVTAVVARRRGENNRDGANATLRQGLIICLFIVVIMGTFGAVFARQLMLLAGAQEGTRILEFATEFFRITIIGFVFSSLGMVINAAQRGCGNTRISMYTNIIANLVSVSLNFLLITGRFGLPELGVRGAAIAMVTGNITMFIVCVINASKSDGFIRLSLKFPKNLASLANLRKFRPKLFDKETLSGIADVSASALVEQLFMRIGFWVTVRLVAGLDTPEFPAITVYTISMNLQNIMFAFGDGLSIASASLVGRSLGAQRPDMAIIYGKVSQRLAFIVAGGLFIVFMFGRYFFVGLFSDTPVVINMAAAVAVLIAVSAPFQIAQVVLTGSLRGAGDTKFVALQSFICIVFVRPGLTWLFCYPLGLGVMGAWVALTIDQSIRLMISFRRFTLGKWTTKKV